MGRCGCGRYRRGRASSRSIRSARRWISPGRRTAAASSSGTGAARRLAARNPATIAFAPDGATLAGGARDGTVHLWHVADGSDRVLVGHQGTVTAVAFAPDGRILASSGDAVRLWDLAGGGVR